MFKRGDFVRLPGAHNPRIIGIVTSASDDNLTHAEICMVAWPKASAPVWEFGSVLASAPNPTGVFPEMILDEYDTIRIKYDAPMLWPEEVSCPTRR